MGFQDPEITEPQLDPKVVRFIEGRAKDVAFEKLSQQLGRSMRTLFRWSRLYKVDIHNMRAAEEEREKHEQGLSRSQLRQGLADDLRRVREELKKRDLSNVSTARLFELEAKLRVEASKQIGPIKLSEPINETEGWEDEDLPDPVVSWED